MDKQELAVNILAGVAITAVTFATVQSIRVVNLNSQVKIDKKITGIYRRMFQAALHLVPNDKLEDIIEAYGDEIKLQNLDRNL